MAVIAFDLDLAAAEVSLAALDYGEVATEFSVTYHGNGSTGGDAPVDSTAYHEGDSATVLGAGTLVRTGHTFAGWNTAADGSGTAYAASASLPIGSADVDLYAQWTIHAHSISFDANGGTGAMASQTGNYGSSVQLTDCSFSRSGYAFAGWATSSGGAVAYADGATVTLADADVALYAVWTLATNIVVGSNSWVTLAEAEAYLASRISSEAWAALSTAQKEAHLISAFYWLFDDHRLVASAATVNDALKRAQIEAALFLLGYAEDYEKREAMRAMGISTFKSNKWEETLGDVTKPDRILSILLRAGMWSGGAAFVELQP